METVLIVEDSRTFASLLTRKLRDDLELNVFHANSYANAAKALETDAASFSIALLDLNLPDAPSGEVVDLVVKAGIPSIVFTGEIDDDLRDKIWAKNIVDYVLKEGMENVEYLISLVGTVLRSRGRKALVVDDSGMMRTRVAELLRIRNFEVLTAHDGLEGLAVIKENPDIRLVVTDYNMPRMDGHEFTKEVRRTISREQMAIIGLSGEGGAQVSAKFIKAGANDYLTKPFSIEELYCRIGLNMELLDYIESNRRLSEHDYLTGLYTRMYLFETGPKILAAHRRRETSPVVALMDIDHFKRINDEFGHDAGDAMLRELSTLVSDRFREGDIVARYGGEELCIVCSDMPQENAAQVFESLRADIEAAEVDFNGHRLKVTVSIGVCATPQKDLEAMITKADEHLYRAKKQGRNTVAGLEEAAD